MLSLPQGFVSLPTPVRAGIAVVGLGGCGAVAYAGYQLKGLIALGIGLAVVAVLLLIYYAAIGLIKKRKAARFQRQMEGHGATTPQSIQRAEQIAKLDDLRKRFDEGVAKFRAAGKDIYSMPWFMIAGEPGSGKTEAIRHSTVGFPAGLQDELQGVGGTINMNWWFTNHAVILDLAGRLIFQDVESGASSEWQEFLRLLNRQRPNCPVNGLILVIPADSLIRDSAEEIQRKGSHIAKQLDVIQRVLDVRFPVFVVITKCDLINGFREFFDDIDNPEAQHQILGWSNPQPIDEAFNPEQVEQHMAGIVDRLVARRLMLLRDPTPAGELSDHRIDEVDALYGFPQSFRGVIPSLKRYLQFIFAAGGWGSKPLFLRGIYFSSAMREGAALDAELASVLGVAPEALSESRMWERDKAYFLRDVFLNKVFAEQGLVTRASNVRRQHQRRNMLLLGAGCGSILLLMLLTWLGGRSLKQSIGKERDLWVYAAQAMADQGASGSRLAIVGRTDQPGQYAYRGSVALKEIDRTMTVSRLQANLQALVVRPIRIPLIFRLSRPFDRSLLEQRREARRAVFEQAVLKPVVEAARARMEREKGSEQPWSDAATAALGELIRIEADAAKAVYKDTDQPAHFINLDALFAYVLGSAEDRELYSSRDSRYFNETLAWCYTAGGGRGVWPPAWLATRGARLHHQKTLAAGVERFVQHCGNLEELVSLRRQLKEVTALWETLTNEFNPGDELRYKEAEDRFLGVFAAELESLTEFRGFASEEVQRGWNENYDGLRKAMEKLRAGFDAIEGRYQGLALFKQSAAAADAAYAQAVSNGLAAVVQCYAALPLPEAPDGLARMAAEKLREKAQVDLDKAAEPDLFEDIRARMGDALVILRKDFQRPGLARDLEEFRKLYAETSTHVHGFYQRFPMFQPIDFPADLRLRRAPWLAFHEQLGKIRVSFVHEDLEKICRKIADVFGGYAGVVDERHKVEVEAIRGKATAGLDRIRGRNFKRELDDVLESWTQLKGQTMADRETLLALSGRDFLKRYLFQLPPGGQDFVQQYWMDVIHEALRSLADDAIQISRGKDKVLRQYARFPLDRLQQGVNPLTAAELFEAVAILRDISPQPQVKEPTTLGQGERTGLAPFDAELQRLSLLDMGDMVGWMADVRGLLPALPVDRDRRMTVTISVLPYAEQESLLLKYGKGDVTQSSVLHVWKHIDEVTDKPRKMKIRTTASTATRLGQVQYPADQLEFRFYQFWSDAQQDAKPRAVTYTGPWGVLRALHENICERGETGKEWKVAIPVTEPGGATERYIWLKFEFEQPLPALDKWPDARSLKREKP